MDKNKDKVIEEVVSKMLEWHKHYKTVRVIQLEDGSLVARKISLIDGKEEDHGVNYEVETMSDEPLPVAGDYSSSLFNDLVFMASVHPADYTGPIKAYESRDVLI